MKVLSIYQLLLVIVIGNVSTEGFLLEYLAAILKVKFFTLPPDKVNSAEFTFRKCIVLFCVYRGHSQVLFLTTFYTADEQPALPEYDFVIVGSGPAGCVLANRLSENPNWKILLLEAGKPENALHLVPSLATYLLATESNWGYLAEPSDAFCWGKSYSEISKDNRNDKYILL